MNIQSRTLVGYLDQLNKTTIDWCQNGVIAFGCHSTVAIFDPEIVQIIQTLDNQKGGIITKLKWSNTKFNKYDLSKEIKLKLAVGDDSGNLTVWDVCEGVIINEFNETPNLISSSKLISDIKWLNKFDNSINNDDFLLSLHSNNNLILWNIDSGSKIWSKNFNETIFQISLDPYSNKRIALLTANYIQFIEDFSLTQAPQSQTRRFHITNANNSSLSTNDELMNRRVSSGAGGLFATASGFLLKTFVENNNDQNKSPLLNKQQDEVSLNDCLQIEFSNLNKNILFVLYSKEIYIFDLIINQTVGYVQLERSSSLFMQMYLCTQRDLIYCLHENGIITVRIRLQDELAEETTVNYETLKPHDFTYDTRTQSDLVRLTKSIKPFSFCVSPINEKTLVLLMSDGRLFTYDLNKQNELVDQNLKSLMKNSDLLKLNLKLNMSTMLNNLPQLPFVMKICPPMTRKNWSYYESLLAIGCSNGDLYTYQLEQNNSLWRKYSLHTNSIRGIEWVSLKGVLTWSNNIQISLNSSNSMQSTNLSNNSSNNNSSIGTNEINNGGKQLVKNEILFTDLRTGETRAIRSDIQNEESPIIAIKTSHLKQYFIIIFKEQPLEIWNLKTLTIIRKLSNKSPIITILEWSPSFSKKPANEDRKLSLNTSASDDQDGVNEATNVVETPTAHQESQNVIVKENFICIDNTGLMYSFFVERHTIKDGSRVLLEDGSLSNIISMALKNDYIVFGDEYGSLNIWELKNKISKTINTKRGAIRKLKFAPGKENLRMLIQYSSNAIEIFDIGRGETISYLKLKFKCFDIDWCSCDRPIILTSDGCIRIFDINLKQIPSQLNYLKYPLSLFNKKRKVFLNKKFSIDEYVAFKYLLFDSLDKNFDYKMTSTTKLNDFFLNDKNYQQNLTEIVTNLNENIIAYLNNQQNEEPSDDNLLKALKSVLKYEKFSTSVYFDCQFEWKFWQVLRNYLKKQIQSRGNDENSAYNFAKQVPNLDTDLIIYDTGLFRQNELKYLKLYELKRVINGQNKNLINDLLLANQLDKVFNLLLETESTNSNYLNDYLKACLVNSMKLNELLDKNTEISNLKSSIKLISTNLIANGKLNDGIQLLCLIGLVQDACRYLQDSQKWDKAIWLAKMRLNDENLVDVIKRWSDYLSMPQINKKNHAILLLISVGQFNKALEIMLNYKEYTQLSLLFLDLCLKYDLVKVKEDDSPNSTTISRDLCNQIYAKNAKLVYKLDNMTMFKELCSKAGSLGEELLSN